MIIRPIIMSLSIATLLSGCGQDLSDLQSYVEEIKQRRQGGIAPIPQVKYYESFIYPNHSRDPFDERIISAARAPTQTTSRAGQDIINRHLNRSPEYLENFPIDSLKMVGTLEQSGQSWALVSTPDSTVQRVTVGNHIGENYGEITSISEISINFIEVVPDGLGGHIEREGSIAISE